MSDRILVRGSGSLACLFAAHLAAVQPVAVLTHWPEQVDALRRRGVTVLREGESVHRAVEVVAAPDPGDRTVVVLVKSGQIERVAAELAPLWATTEAVVALQNGVGAVETLARVVHPAKLVPGITYQAAALAEPGVVRHAAVGLTVLAADSDNLAAARRAAALLDAAGLPVEVTADWEVARWRKLVAATAINALCALIDAPVAALGARPELRRLALAVAAETVAVARARGLDLGLGDLDDLVDRRIAASASNPPSILQDLRRGRRTEVEFINGAVAEAGRSAGVPTPLNDGLTTLIDHMTVPEDPGKS